MDRYEKIAKYVFENFRSEELSYNSKQSYGEFDYYYKNCQKVPVEVTRAVDESNQEINSLLKYKENRKIKRVSSKKSWWLIVKEGTSLKKVKNKLDSLLLILEKNNMNEFFIDKIELCSIKENKELVEALEKISNLKIDYGAIQNNVKGEIVLSPPGRGAKVYDEAIINRIVREECLKADNLRKLNTNKNERHLIIYIDEKKYECWKPFVSILKPQTSPELKIDNITIWLVSNYSYNFIIWRSRDNENWENLGELELKNNFC